MTFDVHQLDVVLLVGSLIILAAVLGVRYSARSGLPTLLFYLLFGVVLGEIPALGIHMTDAQLAHALGFGALAVILAEGGLTTDWKQMRPSIALGTSLATIGVAVSVTIVAVATHYLLGLPWQLAILLGAICSPTDAAAVFSVLRVVPLPKRLTGALEAESGLNDAPTVVLVGVISTGALAADPWYEVTALVVYELAAGLAIGWGVGRVGAWVMRRAALPSSGLYPLAVMCLCFVAYGTAAAVHASGFAAIFIAGLVLGNSELPHRVATRSFAEGLAWLAQIGLFIMLGLLLVTSRLTWEIALDALLMGVVLTFVARPISVFVSAVVQRMSARDLTFISWAGLRGAVPIVLATIPLAEGVEGAHTLFDIVFVMVVIFTVLTGPSLPRVARVLGVADTSAPRGIDVEAAPLDRVAADLLQVAITRESRMHGVEVGELRLPQGASVSLVVRDGQVSVPSPRTVLRHGDELLVVTPRKLRERTEERLKDISRGGRLAHWLSTAPRDRR